MLLNTDLIYVQVIKYLFDKANTGNIDHFIRDEQNEITGESKISCLADMSYIAAKRDVIELLKKETSSGFNPFMLLDTSETSALTLPLTTASLQMGSFQTYEGYADEAGILDIEFLTNDLYLNEHMQAIDNFKSSLNIIQSFSMTDILNDIWAEQAPLYPDQDNPYKDFAYGGNLTLVVSSFDNNYRTEIIEGQRIYGMKMSLALVYTKGYAHSNNMKYEIKRSSDSDDSYQNMPLITISDSMQAQPEAIMYNNNDRIEQIMTPSTSAISSVMYMPGIVDSDNIFRELFKLRYDESVDNENIYNIRVTMPFLVNEYDENGLLIGSNKETFTNSYVVGNVTPMYIPGQKCTFSVDFVLSKEDGDIDETI